MGTKIHEYAELFPAATDAELREMADDILQRGQLCPIITLEGKVLDGRNRLRACELAGVDPKFQKYSGSDPLADVISWNLKRRHLSTSQKATLAVNLKPMFEAQAKERMVAKQNNESGKAARANLPEQTEQVKGRARDQAAAAVGVSGRIVQDAEHVKRQAPEVFEEVKAGRMTVNAAKQEVKQREEKKEETEEKETGKEKQVYVDAMAKAQKATFILSGIGLKNERREEALCFVIAWCKKEIRRK